LAPPASKDSTKIRHGDGNIPRSFVPTRLARNERFLNLGRNGAETSHHGSRTVKLFDLLASQKAEKLRHGDGNIPGSFVPTILAKHDRFLGIGRKGDT
jgi:hypothetical protein